MPLSRGLGRGYDGAVRGAIVVLYAAVLVLAFAQVFFRYVLNQSLSWSEELTRYLFVWLVFVTAGLVTETRQHIVVDIAIERLPARWRRGVGALTTLVVVGFLVALLVVGARLALAAIDQTALSIEMSMAWAYAAIPVGAACMLIGLVRAIRRPDAPAAKDDL